MAQLASGIPYALTAGQDSASAPHAAEDYNALYQRHQPRIFRYCLRVLGNRSDAEDATQETFIRLSRQLDRVVGDPGPYLAGIAHHVCYDLRHKRRTLNVSLDEASTSPARIPGPETEIVESTFLAEMWGALSTRERILLAHAYAGFSYDEIASRAAISAKCVSVSITRARQRLRKLAAAGSSAACLPALVWRVVHRARQHASTAYANTVGTVLQLADQGMAFMAALVASLVAGASMPVVAATSAQNNSSPLAAALQPALASAAARSTTATRGAQTTVTLASPATSNTPSGNALLRTLGSNLPGGNAGPNDGPYESIVASPNYSSDHTILAMQWTTVNCTQCATLLRSTDGGTSWVHVSELGFAGGLILLPPSYPQDNSIFDVGSMGLLMSKDGGLTFNLVAPMPSATAAMMPTSTPGDAKVLVIPQNQPGATWIVDAASKALTPGPVLPAGFVPDSATYVGNNLLLAGRPGSSYATSSAGELVSCAPMCTVLADLPGDSPPFHIAVSPTVSTDHTVVIASYTHLYVSHTDGLSFQAATVPAGDAITGIALQPGQSTPVIVASAFTTGTSRQALVLRSLDGGATYSASTGGLPSVTSLSPIVALPDGRLLGAIVANATTNLYGLRCSSNGGANWSTAC